MGSHLYIQIRAPIYIYSGFEGFVPVDRPIIYGLFLRFFSFKYSAWFVIFVQNAITSFLVFEFCKLFIRKYLGFFFAFILLFLTFFSGIGWYSNQLMPDFFTPLIFLNFSILLFKENLSNQKFFSYWFC